MYDLRPLLRLPLLGFGLGLVAGGFEAIGIGSTLKLALGFADALVLGLASVLLGGLLGLAFGFIAGAVAEVLPRPWLKPRRLAAGMAVTGALFGLWYLVPAGMDKLEQQMIPAALAFWLMPLGVGGVVYFNAHYWARREDIGEERRLGWWFWSAVAGMALAVTSAAVVAARDFGSGRAIATDPAVLLVTVDTLRRDHLSAYGDSPVQTPVFDALAEAGVRYDNAITPFPETAPAHAALLTGRHPVRNGVLSNGHSLARRYTTLAEVLEAEGYATGAFVSSFAVDSRTGLDQGFQVYDDDFFPVVRGFSEIRAARLGLRLLMKVAEPTDFPFLLERRAPDTIARALDFLAQTRDTPAFVWIHLFEPHSPYDTYDDPRSPDAVVTAEGVDHRAILAQEPGYIYTAEERAALRAQYAEEVAYTDTQLGELLAGVEALGLDRGLLTVVTADHGEQLGEHGVEFNHHGIWEESVRVPLVIVPHDPIILRSLKEPVVRQQVRLMDVPSTLLYLLKLDPMADSEGGNTFQFAQGFRKKDFASLLMGRRTASLSEGNLFGYRASFAEEEPEAEGAEDTGEAGEAASAEEEDPEELPGPANVKYIWDPSRERHLLFNLARDPGEHEDLSGAQPAAVEALHQTVAAEVGSLATEGAAASADASVQEALQALGYME